MTPFFRNAAVRHLHWLCHAPQLVTSPIAFDPAHHLPPNLNEILLRWDATPEAGPAILCTTPPRRLGVYFEQLYACVITEIIGWDVVARNVQINDGKQTLGELDFIVRNPQTGALEHHEIAVKFYLGYPDETDRLVMWHGPNAIDRLDLKKARLLNDQSRRIGLPETKLALQDLGVPVPECSRVFMPGYLFYPRGNTIPSPVNVPGNHERGWWMYLDEARNLDFSSWTHLPKPHWLGPWIQSGKPERSEVPEILHQIEVTGTPRLFAALIENDHGRWQEHERIFVVPPTWPQRDVRRAPR